MGKPRLKSTIKSLFRRKPSGTKSTPWVCVEQSRTTSFREAYNVSNSIYEEASSSSSNMCDLNEEMQRVNESRTPVTSSSPLDSEEMNEIEVVLKNLISPQRFFFTPYTTKSIVGDSETLMAAELKLGRDENDIAKDFDHETVDSEEDNCITNEIGFRKESMPMLMASIDPYMDFRVSMEEMVEAHGIRDWQCLQELLHCYLRLNDRLTHRTIALAFVDLLMNLKEDETRLMLHSKNRRNQKEKFLHHYPPLFLDYG